MLEIGLVDVAPLPICAGKRLHDGVTRRFEVPGGMPVRRRIAASDVSASEALPQLDPAASCFQTLLTALRTWFYFSNLICMSALCRHFLLLSDENPTVSEFPSQNQDPEGVQQDSPGRKPWVQGQDCRKP